MSPSTIALPISPSTTAASTISRWVAHFTPEAWVNDHATEVDPVGAQTWDCTTFAQQHAANLVEMTARNGSSTEDVLDYDDVFKSDPAAPQWVREWAGPFSIRLTRANV